MKRFRPPELEGYKFRKPKVKPLSVPSAYKMVAVAHYWKIMPWDLRALPPHQIGELIAAHDVDREIEAYYTGEHMKKADKDSPGERSRSLGKVPFSGRF